MASTLVRDFISTLQEAEQTQKETTLTALFSPDAELQVMTPLHLKPHSPASSAGEFWRRYLHAFHELETHFSQILETKREAVLEWRTEALLPNGSPVEYSGVSIFEHDGEVITRFRTYFDSAALLPLAPRTQQRHSRTAGPLDTGVEICS